MPHLSRFLKHTAGDLMLTTGALDELYSFGWDGYPNETGGVLLGYHRAETRDTVVTHVVGPGPQATHAPNRFEPDHEWQADEVAAHWLLDPVLEYLGDWHTHPGGTSDMSKLDAATLKAIAASPDAQQPRPVMLIIALGAAASSASATRYSSGRFDTLRIRIATEARNF